MSRRTPLSAAGLAIALALAVGATLVAQIPGRNVNMVSGDAWPDGDPFLQRQNEPSIAASTRNPLHLLAGSNDYRTVDLPGLPGGEETGDAWLGLFKSLDGGQRWRSTLLPGYPQDQSAAGLASPLKGYQAGADPVVRAGTNGLFYYNGLVFDRTENGRSAIFVARFIDDNNQEAGDPITYLGASLVAASSGAGGEFLDKPWMAVDVPRGPLTCDIAAPTFAGAPGGGPSRPSLRDFLRRLRESRRPPAAGVQRVPAGAVYVVYSAITGEGPTLTSTIYVTRSFDCGATWSQPMRVSRRQDRINQGATLAIDPRTGSVYVAWRRFSAGAADDEDAIMLARLPRGASRFDVPGLVRRLIRNKKLPRDFTRLFEHRRAKRVSPAQVSEFDQGTSAFSFRTNAYPTMAVDGTGRVYIAWSERGFATLRPDQIEGDARVVMATGLNGRAFTAPRPIDEQQQLGHQIMPSLAFAGGRLLLVYYDVRETRAQAFGRFITDQTTSTGLRQTIDIRAALGTPGETPAFAPSVAVSQYLLGYRSKTATLERLQENPPNLPMFKLGTVPFMGDYIDVAPAPAFVPLGNNRWAFNTEPGPSLPVFHAAWTDNRDVRPPADGNWTNYTPPRVDPTQPPGSSIFDPTVQVPVCQPGNAGSRNQNVYTSRITGGLQVGSPSNSKPLSPTLQRGFVVFAQNATAETRTFRMTILNQPPGGRASFSQFPLPPFTGASPPPVTRIDMRVPPRSTAARTVYATSTDARALIGVDVVEIGAPGAPGPVPDALGGRILLNPDIENPDIENPDIENPDPSNPDIENAEVYNPDIENPDIENPDISNPDIENPDISNPDIENIVVANPDISNPDISNPDISNPDIENPDIENPDISNPDIENGTISDATWKITNTGNTTAAFNVNLFLSKTTLPAGLAVQLIVYKTYTTPVTVPNGCELRFETRNVLVTNVPNPAFITPQDGGVPDQNDPSDKNATLWLGPGEEGRITLRVVDNDKSDNITIINSKGEEVSVDPAFNPQAEVVPAVSSQAVDTDDAETGTVTQPPLVTPTGSNLFFLQQPVAAVENQPLAPAVQIQVRENASGLPVAGATVTLGLGANPGGALLTGGDAITDASGIAVFPQLRVTAPGSGYTIVAAAASPSGSATATSNAFDVAPATPLNVVTHTGDTGRNSLRAAIEFANSTAGVAEVISFAIPGAGPHVIAPQTELPPITDPVTIDGTTQPGYDGAPVVEIDGIGPDGYGLDAFGLEVRASNVTVRGLAITRFGLDGIFADEGQSGLVIDQNHVGTDRAGSAGRGNASAGLRIRSSATRVTRNVISGNAQGGIELEGSGGAQSGVEISENRIGTTPDGLTALPNEGSGVSLVSGSHGTLITGNLIAGNRGWGVDVRNGFRAAVTDTQVLASTIGLNAAGAALGNGAGGVHLDNAPGSVVGAGDAGNIISGNEGPGVVVEGEAVPLPVIRNNRIGTEPAGLAARPNVFEGVVLGGPAIIGGTGAGEGNLIAGNGNEALAAGTGVLIGSGVPGTLVQGNVIGLNAAGVALGNGYSGITVYAATGATIGGTMPGARNVLSGNPHAGVAIYRVGADPLPTNIVVQGNFIGTNAAGTAFVPNGGWGIDASGLDITIGGDEPGAANLIAGNGLATRPGTKGGVAVVDPASRVTILSNVIRDNVGLGIDLAANGVTPNDAGDADAGPNGLLNFPVLSSPVNSRISARTQVNFALSTTAPEPYRLQFFANGACDGSGFGEGARLVGSIVTSMTSGTAVLDELLPFNTAITATATDGAGNTSEFSACVTVTSGVFQWRTEDGGNDHYYEYVRTPGSWTAARDAAVGRLFEGRNGHLATLTTAAENAFANSLRAGGDLRAWIGLTDQEVNTVFKWITGEPFLFANWSAGEPNHLAGEDYVEMFGSGRWNDNTNATPFNQGFLVEWVVPQ